MKDSIQLIPCLTALLLLAACGDDDGPRSGDTRTIQPTVINHIVDNNTGEVDIEATVYKFVLNTSKPAVDATVQVGTQRYEVPGCTTAHNPSGFFNYSSPGNGSVSDLNGYIDLNEGSIRCTYRLDNRYRVIATMAEVFFLSTSTRLTYDDGTASTDNSTLYQFTIDPTTMKATVYVMSMLHSKEGRFFNNIIAHDATVNATADGYRIAVADADCQAAFRHYNDKTGSNVTETLEYKITDFTATLDLENAAMNTSFDLKKMKRDATPQEVLSTTHITASGTTYASSL